MTDDTVPLSSVSTEHHSSMMAAPAGVASSSSTPHTDCPMSSTDLQTRRSLEARLDVTNVAAKTTGAQATRTVTCMANPTPSKLGAAGTSGVGTVSAIPLTDFHPPNVTSVIDAATNSPLPNTANKNAAAKLQEQLMFGAAQRVTSMAVTSKAGSRGHGEGPLTPSPSSTPAIPTSAGSGVAMSLDGKSLRPLPDEATPSEVPSHPSGIVAVDSNGHFVALRSPAASAGPDGNGSPVALGCIAANSASVLSGSREQVGSSPPSQVTSPKANLRQGTTPPNFATAADPSSHVAGVTLSGVPAMMPVGAAAVPMAAMAVGNHVGAGTGGPQMQAGPVYSGQPMAVAENHIPASANHFSAAGQPAHVAADSQQHRQPVYPYFVDPEVLQNGFPPGMFISAVSSAGQFIPQGMAVCAQPILPQQSAQSVRPNAAAPPAMQPMTYLSRAIMMPNVVQLDGSNAAAAAAAAQYYYPDILSAGHMNKMVTQPAIVPRILPTAPGVHSDPPSGRHSQATSPTTSPRPGILRKRNHDGSRKQGNSSGAPDRNSAGFTNGVPSGESVSQNGESTGMDTQAAETHRLPGKASGSQSSSRSVDHTGRSIPAVLSQASSKSSRTAISAPSATAHPASNVSSSASALPQSLSVAQSASTTGVSPRKKPRKQVVVVTEDPLSSNVPSGNSFPGSATTTATSTAGGGGGRSRGGGHHSPGAAASSRAAAPKAQKEGIHQFPLRRRMPVAYGGGYVARGKVAYNHFTRASDVRVKDEKKATLSDLATKFSKKPYTEELQGGRLNHILANINKICAQEQEKADRYYSYYLEDKWKDDPDLEEEVDGIMDLLQGNIQRSKALIEQLTEAKQTLLKTLEHTGNVQDLLTRLGSQKPKKKSSANS